MQSANNYQHEGQKSNEARQRKHENKEKGTLNEIDERNKNAGIKENKLNYANSITYKKLSKIIASDSLESEIAKVDSLAV